MPRCLIDWPQAWRVIASRCPPINLYERLTADTAVWDALIATSSMRAINGSASEMSGADGLDWQMHHDADRPPEMPGSSVPWRPAQRRSHGLTRRWVTTPCGVASCAERALMRCDARLP